MVANGGDADPGVVGEQLRARGFSLVACEREAPHSWPDLDGVDLVLSLGSDWSVYWDHVAASVGAESELLRAAHQRTIPVLGICFGAQLLAAAHGGSVQRAPSAEIGWFEVQSTEPAVAGDGPWFQWHADRFTAPPAATLLAQNTASEQAFCLGRSLGLQFHPEVDLAIVSRWAAGGGEELTRVGVDPAGLLERTHAEASRARAAAVRLVDWFLTEVAGR